MELLERGTIKIKRSRGYRVINTYRCTCGKVFTAREENVKSGNTRSCGCLLRQILSTRDVVKHRHCSKGISPTYRSWDCMKARCLRPSSPNFSNYGGRGIQICGAWHVFSNFLKDMGVRPNGMTLDRIDPDGNYEPDNCRWASAKTQATNKRKSR